MPREPWRDDPEYVGLWRAARREPDDRAPRLVLADWLEEHGHGAEAWRERLHALTGRPPAVDPDRGTARAGLVPRGEGAWRRLLAAPPADDLLCVFDRDVVMYQYLRQYRGRCGVDLGQADWSSRTERAHLLAVPRLEMVACDLARPADWDWIMRHLSGLTHFEATGPMIVAGQLPWLKRLPRLRGLVLRGRAAANTTAVGSLPRLRHLSLGPYYYPAARLAELAPQVESLHADPAGIGETALWPRLRSLRMQDTPGGPLLGTQEVTTLALHPHLEQLNVHCGRLRAEAVHSLAALPRLRELTLRFEGAAPPSLKALARAPALESLTVEGPVGERQLAEVVKLSRLRVLSLGRVEAGGRAALAAVTGMRQLEELRLYGEGVDGNTLPALAALPRLERLDVQFLKMSAATARAVKAACPPWVECVAPAEEG